MIALLEFATLFIATVFAAVAAVALHLLLVRATFLLMRPATAQRVVARAQLSRGTAELARAYASHR